MSRVPFSEIIKNSPVNVRREYERLFTLFSRQEVRAANGVNYTIRKYCSEYFIKWPFRGTCITLRDFDEFHGFMFNQYPPICDTDFLILFCEYSFNLVSYYLDYAKENHAVYATNIINEMQIFIQQVLRVVESIGYMKQSKEGIINFIPKDQVVISVAEIIDPSLSYRVIEYNHHSMKGQLIHKRDIILALADKLEPQRAKLKQVNSSLETDLFFLFNNVNLRHNNADPKGKNYKPFIAGMKSEEIEKWYDDTYQMCLLAFLEMDHEDRKARVAQLKQDIQK